MNIDEKYYFDNLAFKSIQDKNQVILFSDKYKRWFRLNVIGKQILDKMDGNTTIKNIAEGIAQEYEIPCEVVLKDVDNFCIKALDQEFIVEEKSKELLNHRVDLSLSNIYIDVTNKCNLSCAYCSKCVKDEELGVDINFNNLKEYLNLLLEEKKAEDTIVNITGGEPLLNKELRQILEYLKSKKLRVILWTNGFYLDDSNIQWIKENCTFVAIPLDSVNEENNDRIRGKGAYEASIKAINLCKKHNIDVIISATATVFNINELKEIAILGESLEVYSMVINEPIKIDSANNRILEYFDFQEEIIEEKWREILGHTAVLSSWHNYNSDKVVFSACRMQDTCLNSVY
ncbi:hypothetical protein M918_19145 [Clostridium sp. BL8]|nr:PqqD family peptide modification chaperone [Clostridium sp. BL8]EQB89717.1 hypothetical protein M918_19145 [Clostridium sp. BL8]